MDQREKAAMRVSLVSVFVNTALSLFKLFSGIYAGSAAMISDAVHSISDVFSTFIVMAGVKTANKKPDASHQYGHERFECVAALILSGVLAVTGLGIGWSGVRTIAANSHSGLAAPGGVALLAAVISIVTQETMYWYTRATAKKIESGALMADAWHHRSDALSSVGSFAGILGARLGMPVLDPVAAIVICLFILKAAYSIFMDAVGKMTDRSCDEAVVADMRKLVLAQPEVRGVDQIKTRLFGDRIYVDIEIRVDGAKTLDSAHGIAQCVHDAIEEHVPKVKHCMVHVNPDGSGEPPGEI